MKHLALIPLLLAAAPASPPAPAPKPAPSPPEIVAAAPASDWVAIAASDLLVMDLAADAKGPSTGSGPRRVIIQLMPPPFSQGWISNIRKLAAARWWDGTSVNRVQDNYVVQWGDATEKKALPGGLSVVGERDYATLVDVMPRTYDLPCTEKQAALDDTIICVNRVKTQVPTIVSGQDRYSQLSGFYDGWPVGLEDNVVKGELVTAEALEKRKTKKGKSLKTEPFSYIASRSIWPVHCYGMVGVGRGLPPDTGTGTELYTVIGHAPRHLDRNIALVGRVIEGIEHLSSLPRGTGALGFYETAEERVPIRSIRLLGEMEIDPVPRFEYLSTESKSFASYADARANRRDPFFIQPAGGADICNIPVPVRRAP